MTDKRRIKISSAAAIIQIRSGHRLSSTSLRMLIIRKRWPYWAEKIDGDWIVDLDEVLKYATDFNGLKRGRPHHVHEPFYGGIDPRTGKKNKRDGATCRLALLCKSCDKVLKELTEDESNEWFENNRPGCA